METLVEHFQHPGREEYVQRWRSLLGLPRAQVLPQNPHFTENESQLFGIGYQRRIVTVAIRLVLESKEKSLC